MAKVKTTYVCSECKKEYSQWMGQCKECKSWNTVEEGFASKTGKVNEAEVVSHVGYAGRSGLSKVEKLSDVKSSDFPRSSTGFSELDIVLGGGVVEGSVILLGGDPGIGKSTLLFQTLENMSKKGTKKTLYVSGEESKQQIKLRAERLGLNTDWLYIIGETNVDNIIKECNEFKPEVLIIDSIQVMFTSDNPSAPGSKRQLEDATKTFSVYGKQNGISTFIIGHVTKDGSIAGPKILEHIVDTVLYFEGEKESKFRMIRANKNRFGETGEIAIFTMTEKGLEEITNPSAIFLTKYETPISGSSLLVTREGSRNLIIEVQSLVTESTSEYPQRRSVGLEKDRLELIIAILQKKLSLKLWNKTIFVNVVGGVKVNETGSDLSVIVAMISSYYDKPLPTDLVVFGEIGLSGEVRTISNGEERIKEAIKQGMKTFIVPKGNAPKDKKLINDIKKMDIKLYAISDLYALNEVLTQLF